MLVDNDEANKSIGKTGKEADGLGKKLGRGIKTAGKWALGITTAAVGIGAAAFAMTKKVANSFDEIAKGSTKIGVTTDAYQEMDYWAGQNGVSSENMEKAVGRLNQRIGMAADGNDKYSSALERLGVDMDSVKDGTISTEDAMYQSIQSLSEMESETDKAALASELFGTKMGRELMPALQDGSLSLEDAAKKAEELGIVIDGEALEAAETFNDTWDDLTRSMGAFGKKVIADLMPIFQSMMDWIIDHMPQIQAIFQTVFDVVGIILGGFIGVIKKVIGWFSEFKESNTETFTNIWETIQEVFSNVLEFLTETWDFIREMWEENGQNILDSVISVFTTIYEFIEFAFETIWSVIQEILDLVVPFVQKTLDKLFSFWDENGEKIMKAVDNVFSFVQGVIEFVMPILIAVIKGAWDIITSAFDIAIGVIMGLVDFFASLLTGDFEGMKDALIGIFESIWDGIKGIVEGAWNLLSGAFRALWGSVSGWFTDLKDDAVDWGKNMIQGFIDGIKNMGENVAKAAKGVVDKAAGFLKFWSPAKEGEGRFITDWGENMVDGFLDGVRNETDEAGKVMDDLIEGMNPKTLDFNANVRRGSTGMATGNGQVFGGSAVVDLLLELIQAVKEGKEIVFDDGKFAGRLEPKLTSIQERKYFRGRMT